MSTARAHVPTPEQLKAEYQEKLAESARFHYRNADLMQDWVEYTEPALAPRTRPAWRTYSRHVSEWAEKEDLHFLVITRKEALGFAPWLQAGEYKGRRAKAGQLSAATVLNHLTYVDLFYEYLHDVKGLTFVNPFAGLVKLFIKQHKSELRPDLRALDEEEVGLMLEGAETLDEFATGLLLFKTGMRRDECALIRMSQIDWESQTISLDPHPKRTYLKVYFDDETEFFLRLVVARNLRDYPGNPYLWPSPVKKKKHVCTDLMNRRVRKMVLHSPLKDTVTNWKNNLEKITTHTMRRAFTSVMKRHGCPEHIVAVLRGDSLRTRSELVHEPTQGIYTKMGKMKGKPELRFWYNKCMPQVGAREIWERAMPRAVDAESIEELIRRQRISAA